MACAGLDGRDEHSLCTTFPDASASSIPYDVLLRASKYSLSLCLPLTFNPCKFDSYLHVHTVPAHVLLPISSSEVLILIQALTHPSPFKLQSLHCHRYSAPMAIDQHLAVLIAITGSKGIAVLAQACFQIHSRAARRTTGDAQ